VCASSSYLLRVRVRSAVFHEVTHSADSRDALRRLWWFAVVRGARVRTGQRDVRVVRRVWCEVVVRRCARAVVRWRRGTLRAQ
jgi:hypothetical protein